MTPDGFAIQLKGTRKLHDLTSGVTESIVRSAEFNQRFVYVTRGFFAKARLLDAESLTLGQGRIRRFGTPTEYFN